MHNSSNRTYMVTCLRNMTGARRNRDGRTNFPAESAQRRVSARTTLVGCAITDVIYSSGMSSQLSICTSNRMTAFGAIKPGNPFLPYPLEAGIVSLARSPTLS